MAEKQTEAQEKKLEVTPLEQWEVPTYLLEIPSGRVVRVRTLELQGCIVRGEVPNTLLGVVSETMSEGTAAAMDRLQGEDPTKLLQLMYWMVEQVMVEPKVWNGEGKKPADAIGHEQLSDEDHNEIVTVAMSGPAVLAPFREE